MQLNSGADCPFDVEAYSVSTWKVMLRIDVATSAFKTVVVDAQANKQYLITFLHLMSNAIGLY